MTEYPNSFDYVEALQDPELVFRDPTLQRAEFTLHPQWHTPLAVSGNAAVVFRATVAGRDQALRFFIREDVSEKQRYTALDRHFVTHSMQDWVSQASWVDSAIAVNGRRWPMVMMDWIDGDRLDEHVRALADRRNPVALDELAADWRARVHQVQTAAFAHGDLQHGNVLVEPSGALRLVDFDGSWIAAFDGFPPPNERGHPNYQHVRRAWGRWMDTFPALVIYTGLLALSRKPDAWRNNEGILFTHEDLLHPGTTPTWDLLAEIGDPAIEHAVQRLRSACRPEWQPDGDLEALLGPEQTTVTGPAGSTSSPVFALSPNPDKHFYDDRPATGARPTDAAEEKTFGGVSGKVDPIAPDPDPEPVAPTPPDEPPVRPAVVLAAASIALVLALLLGIAVGANDGPGAVVGVVTAIVVFAVALPLLRRRR